MQSVANAIAAGSTAAAMIVHDLMDDYAASAARAAPRPVRTAPSM